MFCSSVVCVLYSSATTHMLMTAGVGADACSSWSRGTVYQQPQWSLRKGWFQTRGPCATAAQTDLCLVFALRPLLFSFCLLHGFGKRL